MPTYDTIANWFCAGSVGPPSAYKKARSDARIVTNYEYPPIPDRRFDWSAVDDRTYDGEGCPVGRGSTEKEAVNDLLDQICMQRGADVDHSGGCKYCSAEQGIQCRAEIVGQRR